PDREIIITAGSIEGITATLLATTDPGDEVLLPSPSYVSYVGAIRLAGCIPRFFPLDEDHNFDFQVEQVEQALTRKTKVLLYCSPNNPTGTVFSEHNTRRLMTLCKEKGITVLIDEVYKDFYFEDI